jgi:endoglucanase
MPTSAIALFSLLPLVSGIGINLGNVLEAPTEGAWAPVAQEFYFSDYKARGFSAVRIPVRWDNHTSQQPPYTVDPTFMARVQTVVGWSLARNFTTIINAHHDDWVNSEKDFEAKLPRYLAIWRQVAAAFASAPAALLRFETLNEPTNLTLAQLNDMHARVLPVMRVGGENPVREVYLVGLSWDGADWLLQHPDAIEFPPLPNGSVDPHLRVEVHSYDPYQFCLQNPPTASSWGTPAEVAAVVGRYKGLGAWAASKGRAVLMGEAGCFVKALNRADRLQWYQTIGAAQQNLPDSVCIWDDNGDYKVYSASASALPALRPPPHTHTHPPPLRVLTHRPNRPFPQTAQRARGTRASCRRWGWETDNL